jgi:uncharacterized protein YndB with AHSA1/START domain
MTLVDLTGMAVEVTVRFSQPPEAVWALLTDVERMAGLGPEHFRARWLTSGPAVGARFEGWNRIGEREWGVTCVVTACRPAEFIEWNVGEGPLPSSTWSYILTPDGEGSTLVTQQFRHGPGESGVSKAVEDRPERAALIVEHRSNTLRTNMISTLEAATRLLEGQGGALDIA